MAFDAALVHPYLDKLGQSRIRTRYRPLQTAWLVAPVIGGRLSCRAGTEDILRTRIRIDAGRGNLF